MGNSQSEIRKYNAVLDDIQKQRINMDDKVTKKNNEILHDIREKLFHELVKDDLFGCLFKKKKVYYTGSFYERLRISAATEFDINLILTLPFDYDEDLDLVSSNKSFSALFLNKDLDELLDPDHPTYKGIKKYFLDKETSRRFNALSIHRWFIGLMHKALERLRYVCEHKGRTYRLDYSVKSQSGPAHTLRVTTGTGDQKRFVFDVDFVPVFQFDNVLIGDKIYEYKYLVPKKPREKDGKNTDHIFRFSYAPEEDADLKNQKNAKTVIKFLKLLRDEQRWCLVSYHLKTIVMNLDFKEWNNERNLIEYLREAAESLECCLRDHYLPMKHDKQNNLFAHVDPRTLENMANQLSNIIKNVEKDRDQLYKYLNAKKNGSRRSEPVANGDDVVQRRNQTSEEGSNLLVGAAGATGGGLVAGEIAYSHFKKEGQDLTDGEKVAVGLTSLAGAFVGYHASKLL